MTIGGVVHNFQRRFTRSGEPMARFTLEDTEGSIEVTVFPKAMAEAGDLLAEDAVVLVRGRPDRRGEGETAFLANELLPIDLRRGPAPLWLNVERVDMDEDWLVSFEKMLASHPGDAPVHLRVGDRLVKLPESRWVDAGALAGPLREILGADAVRT